MEKNFSTKDNILEAAIEEFLEKGFKEASIRDIAAKVGITSTALYRHFRSADILHVFIDYVLKEISGGRFAFSPGYPYDSKILRASGFPSSTPTS